MTNAEIIRHLKSYKGEVLVSFHGRDDVFFVKCVKSDMIEMLSKRPAEVDEGLMFEINHGTAYIDRDYSTDND